MALSRRHRQFLEVLQSGDWERAASLSPRPRVVAELLENGLMEQRVRDVDLNIALRRTGTSNTDPNVAKIATMLSTVPNTADRTGEEDCTGGDASLLLAFCFFAAICRSCWIRFFGTWPGRSPSDSSDRWMDPRTLRRRTA